MSMIQDPTSISGQKEMRTAHLDEAHIGDIKGAWGTIASVIPLLAKRGLLGCSRCS